MKRPYGQQVKNTLISEVTFERVVETRFPRGMLLVRKRTLHRSRALVFPQNETHAPLFSENTQVQVALKREGERNVKCSFLTNESIAFPIPGTRGKAELGCFFLKCQYTGALFSCLCVGQRVPPKFCNGDLSTEGLFKPSRDRWKLAPARRLF